MTSLPVGPIRGQTWAILATLLGAALRFRGLGDRPLWIDEAIFWHLIDAPYQEFIPAAIAMLLPRSEFWLRFPAALAGTLTIYAVWFVSKNRRYAIWWAFVVATCPLFVFWSQMARPYALAGLFVVLGWRWAWMQILAVGCTPFAIMGVSPRISIWVALLMLAVFAASLIIRPDTGKFNLDFILTVRRFWYVPTLVLGMWATEYVLPFVERRLGKRRGNVLKVGHHPR